MWHTPPKEAWNETTFSGLFILNDRRFPDGGQRGRSEKKSGMAAYCRRSPSLFLRSEDVSLLSCERVGCAVEFG